jgi:hypothetical protein
MIPQLPPFSLSAPSPLPAAALLMTLLRMMMRCLEPVLALLLPQPILLSMHSWLAISSGSFGINDLVTFTRAVSPPNARRNLRLEFAMLTFSTLQFSNGKK